MNRLALARTLMDEADYQIVLAHQPLTDAYFYEMDIYQSEEVMSLSHAILALSGHYCGGQWRLPWTDRALYVPGLGYQPEERQYVGLSRPGGLTQYISPGLGAAGFYRFQPGRLYNPPAVTLITLSGR
jgi:predicted MPP superfamily phosphohydrolase